MGCEVLGLAHFLGRRWTIALFEQIALDRFTGFNDILRKSGMTPKMLSYGLKEMVSLGLVDKKDGKPNYILTEKGKEFRKIIQEIKKFNIKWNNIQEGCLGTSCLECGRFVENG